MTDGYVRSKVKEALVATEGDRQDAQKLLITWAVRDQMLLLGLAKPHLKEISSLWIKEVSKKPAKESHHAAQGRVGDKRTATKVPPPKTSLRQASVMKQIVEAFKKKK